MNSNPEDHEPDLSTPSDGLLARLKSSVSRAARESIKVEPRVEAPEVLMRDSVRQLARNRISLALRQLRAAHGLSYADIQERTGLSQQLLWDVEYKDSRLALDELELIAQCYEMSASDILGIELDVSNRLTFERIRQSTGLDGA